MRRLRRRHVSFVLRRSHMRCLSIKYSIWSRIDSVDKLRVQRRLHGAQRRDVRCVRGGEVQDSHWHCRMHELRRQQV